MTNADRTQELPFAIFQIFIRLTSVSVDIAYRGKGLDNQF